MKATLALALLFLAVSVSAETLHFKVTGMDCSSCAPPVLRALKSVPGVAKATIDWKSGAASVESKNAIAPAAIRQALDSAGFAVVFPGEKDTGLEPLAPADLAKIDLVSYRDGRKFDVAKLVVPGKVTIVDFYGDWCGPCRVLESRLEHYLVTRPGIAIRRIDIGKWDNDAARQATHDFRTAELPYLRFYDRNGKFSSAVTGGMWDEVLAAIEKASK